MDWYLLPVFAGVELEPHADVELPLPQLVPSQKPVGDQTPAGTRNTKTIVQHTRWCPKHNNNSATVLFQRGNEGERDI